VHRDGGQVALLNSAATLCWHVLQNGGQASDAALKLKEAFNIELTAAQRDAASFWRQMQPLLAAPKPTIAAQRKPANIRGEAGTTRLIALGHATFRIMCRSPAVCEAMEGLISPLTKETAAPDFVIDLAEEQGEFVLACDGTEIGRERTADRMLGLLISEITDRAYPDANWAAVMHAGAVAWENGCIVIPAPSGRGKSLLVAGLIHSGLSYLSDDSAPLDAVTGAVMPVPLALAVKESGRAALEGLYPQLASQKVRAFVGGPRRFLDLIGKSAVGGSPLRAFISPHYSQSAEAGIVPSSPIEMLSAMVEAGCWISPEPASGRKVFELLSSNPAFRVHYRHLDEGVLLVKQVIARLDAKKA
jgi:hypothetical protein